MEKYKIQEKIKEARKDVWRRVLTYIAAGLGIVIGLAWNDAITALVKKLFPEGNASIIAKFIYALLLTIIVGIILYYIDKNLNKPKEE